MTWSGGHQSWGGLLRPFFVLAWIPLGFGSHRSAGVGAIGSDSLVSGDDGTKDPLDDTLDALVKQHELFEAAFKDVDTVFEVGLALCGVDGR